MSIEKNNQIYFERWFAVVDVVDDDCETNYEAFDLSTGRKSSCPFIGLTELKGSRYYCNIKIKAQSPVVVNNSNFYFSPPPTDRPTDRSLPTHPLSLIASFNRISRYRKYSINWCHGFHHLSMR